MNGGLRGELGLQSYHQSPSLHGHHPAFTQPEAAHYDTNTATLSSLNPLQSLAPAASAATAGLGQYVLSSTPQQSQPPGDIGYPMKLNTEAPADHTLLSMQPSSSSFSSLPHQSLLPNTSSSSSSLPPLISHPSLAAQGATCSPLAPHPVGGTTSAPLVLNPSIPPGTSSAPSPTTETTGGTSSVLLTQMNQLGPSERCTASQAQSMGQQLLGIMAQSKRAKNPLPSELQSSFDVFHRCLAVVYGTFFLNLYTKANAPCLLCHGCKSLYPPGQFIHHTCPTVPPNILPCRSRMWRRCLVPLVSPGMDKLQQKQRWKYVLEKFSHTAAALAGRRNPIPPEIESQLLEMPELKRGRFIESPTKQKPAPSSENGAGSGGGGAEEVPTKVGGASTAPPATVKMEESFEERLGVEGGGASVGDGGIRFQGLINLEERECLKQEGSTSPEGAQNLLDIEPPEYEMDDGTSPTDSGQAVASSSQSGSAAALSTVAGTGSALGLAEQLIGEVKKLQQEVGMYRAKLRTATEIIEKMPSEACMREQLAQALAIQQTLMVERDQAREQLKLAQERSSRLQRQMDNLRTAYDNMERLFTM